VNYISYVLSSYQVLQYPSVLNHYLFEDPAEGTNFTYPNTANGDLFSTAYYPDSANGGLFFPWGYPLFNSALSADLGVFKGDTTLTIVPSSLDETYYAIIKIMYDFENNDNVVNVEKGIVQNILSNNTVILNAGSPKETNVEHIFTSQSLSSTTYYPTITVLNGNLGQNVFNLKLTILPDSLFKFDDFHLVNTAQLTRTVDNTPKSIEIMEIDSNEENFVSNFILLSTTVSHIVSSSGLEYTPTPTPTQTPTNTPTPTVTPSVTPTPSFTPTTSNPAQLGVEFVTYE